MVSGLLWEGSISSCPHPARSSSSLIQGQDDVVLQVRVIGAVGCKGDMGYAGFVTWSPLPRTISAPNCSNAARKSAPEPSFSAYNRGSGRTALASAVPMSWQVFPRQGREDTSRAACTTSCAQKRATALHTRGWTDVAGIPHSWTAPPAWPLYDEHKVIPYGVSWTPLRWKQSTHSQLEHSSSNSEVSVMNLTTGHL